MGDSNLKLKIAAWIPSHIPGKVIFLIYRVFAFFDFISRKKREENHHINNEILGSEESPLADGYIDNQYRWGRVRFGHTDMAFAGCEIMAAYNALRAAGHKVGIEKMCELITAFEQDGAAFKGKFGSSPASIRRHLKNDGLQTGIVWDENNISKETDIAIATFYNDKNNLYEQIHTVTIVREEKGFRAYNSETCEYFVSIKDSLRGIAKNPKTICVIEVAKQ